MGGVWDCHGGMGNGLDEEELVEESGGVWLDPGITC